MSHDATHKRLAILDSGIGSIEGMSRKITDLTAAIAEICKGQLSQDEAICAMQRRIQGLETEREMEKQSTMKINGG